MSPTPISVKLTPYFPQSTTVSPFNADCASPALNNGRRGMEWAIEFAAKHFGEELTLRLLAKAAGMPSNTLTRKFNSRFGISPMRWLWTFRTFLAAEMIAVAPEWPLTDIAIHCGFGSSAHFSRRFRAILGIVPSRHRQECRKRLQSLHSDPRAPIRFFDESPVIVARALSRSKGKT